MDDDEEVEIQENEIQKYKDLEKIETIEKIKNEDLESITKYEMEPTLEEDFDYITYSYEE